MKIVFSIVLIALSFTGFSQSFSVDNKSLSVPRYANQTAITAAIPTPTNGMLVYNDALSQYAYYNGSAWTNFPIAGAGGGGVPWTLNSTTNRAVTNSGVEINRSASNSASPDLFLRSPNTNIRMAGTTGEASFLQTAIVNATPGSASMNFIHLNSANPPTQTVMMSVNGEGNLTVHGFSKLGGAGAAVPAIKQLLFTGTTAGSLANTTTLLVTTVAHGITNFDKILSVEVYVKGYDGGSGPEIWVAAGYNGSKNNGGYGNIFNTHYDATNIYIERPSGINGNNLGGRPYKILITYTN